MQTAAGGPLNYDYSVQSDNTRIFSPYIVLPFTTKLWEQELLRRNLERRKQAVVTSDNRSTWLKQQDLKKTKEVLLLELKVKNQEVAAKAFLGLSTMVTPSYWVEQTTGQNLGTTGRLAVDLASPYVLGKGILLLGKSGQGVSKLARLGISPYTGNWTKFGSREYRFKPGYLGMNGAPVESRPVKTIRLYRATGTNGKFDASLDGGQEFAGQWFTNNSTKPLHYASMTVKRAKRAGVENPIELLYVDIPESELSKYKASEILKGRTDIEYEPTEDFLIPLDYSRLRVPLEGYTGNLLTDARKPLPELPIINNLTSHVQGDEAVKMFKEYGGTPIPEGSLFSSVSKAAKATPEQWTAAQDAAIARGDMAEAQRLRDLHFIVNTPENRIIDAEGNPVKMIHGSLAKFTEFRHKDNPHGMHGRGMYFSIAPESGTTNYGGDNGYKYLTYLNGKGIYPNFGIIQRDNIGKMIPNDLMYEIIGTNSYNEFINSVTKQFKDKFDQLYPHIYDVKNIEKTIDKGLYQKIHDTFDTKVNGADIHKKKHWFKKDEKYATFNPKMAGEIVVRDPNQIKLADAVTYNDKGVRIPLGERDNFKLNDTRWGLLPFLGLGATNTLLDKKQKGGKMNILQFLKNGSGIHIKKKNRGSFRRWCGGNVTEECIRKGKASSNPKIRKKATFASNVRKWKHLQGGLIKKAQEGTKLLASIGINLLNSYLNTKASSNKETDSNYLTQVASLELEHSLKSKDIPYYALMIASKMQKDIDPENSNAYAGVPAQIFPYKIADYLLSQNDKEYNDKIKALEMRSQLLKDLSNTNFWMGAAQEGLGLLMNNIGKKGTSNTSFNSGNLSSGTTPLTNSSININNQYSLMNQNPQYWTSKYSTLK